MEEEVTFEVPTDSAPPPEFLTIAEAAQRVRCERTIRRAIQSGAQADMLCGLASDDIIDGLGGPTRFHRLLPGRQLAAVASEGDDLVTAAGQRPPDGRWRRRQSQQWHRQQILAGGVGRDRLSGAGKDTQQGSADATATEAAQATTR